MSVTAPGRREASADEPALSRQSPQRRGLFARGEHIPYLLILPALAVLVLILGYPLVRLIDLSFQNVNSYLLLAAPQLDKYIGFDGFTHVLSDDQFWEVILRTLYLTVETVGISIVLSLGVAKLLARVSPWVRVLVVTVLMFVWSIPAIVTGTVFRWIFSNTSGVADYICYLLGGKGMLNHDWFANPNQGLYVVVAAVIIWGAMPFLVIGFHAAMSQVPKELVEAAKIDGAGPWQSFYHVVLPIIRPFLMIATALSVIWNFQVFAQIWSLRQSSPEPGYWTIGVYLYERGLVNSHYSDGAVISIAMILLLLAVLVFYIRQMIKIGAQD